MKLINASKPRDFEDRDEPVVLELREDHRPDTTYFLYLKDEDIAAILRVTASR